MTIGKGLSGLAILAALVGAPSPASAAWVVETHQDVAAGIQNDVAYVEALKGAAALALSCYYEEPDFVELIFAVYTGEDYDRTASYAASVPVRVTADGETFDLSARFHDFGGELIVSASEYDDGNAGLFFVLLAMEVSVAPIEIAFFKKSLLFPVENAESAVGYVIDACL